MDARKLTCNQTSVLINLIIKRTVTMHKTYIYVIDKRVNVINYKY